MIDGPFPGWLEERLVGEEQFAGAFARVPDEQRAWLKTCLARLFDWYGLHSCRRSHRERSWSSGLFSLELSEPLEWCLVRVFPADRSPCRLMAAVLPPVLAGVENLAVVCDVDTAPWTDGQLLALELAGVENACSLHPGENGRLEADLEPVLSRGACIELGTEGPSPAMSRELALSRALPAPAVGVWAAEADWDMSALAFALPGDAVQIWLSGQVPPDDPAAARTGTWQEFLDSGFDTVYVPASRLREALPRARRAFGPGQEGCWIWPELSPDQFSRYAIAWADEPQED